MVACTPGNVAGVAGPPSFARLKASFVEDTIRLMGPTGGRKPDQNRVAGPQIVGSCLAFRMARKSSDGWTKREIYAGQAMKTEFRKAVLPRDLHALMAFDRATFLWSDLFPAAYWKTCESWWLLVGGIKVGCCAFQRNVDFQEDLNTQGTNPEVKGCLYIETTGILPKYQGRGLGRLMKSWQISYASWHGFTRIVTNTRKRNIPMIELNKRFGFEVIRTTPRYYRDPIDATVVMERTL